MKEKSLQIDWETSTREQIENAIGVDEVLGSRNGLKKLKLEEINLLDNNKNVECVKFCNYIDDGDEYIPDLYFHIVFECDPSNSKEAYHRRRLTVGVDVKSIRTSGIDLRHKHK